MSADNLSSGEKSIAALALFFAINEALQTPIIFVDEVDAHLDINNAFKLMQILHHVSNISKKQIVYISHRPTSFKYSDVLLGIHYESESKTSRALSVHNDSSFTNTVQSNIQSNSNNAIYKATPIQEEPYEQDVFE